MKQSDKKFTIVDEKLREYPLTPPQCTFEKTEYFKCECGNEILAITEDTQHQDFSFAIYQHYHKNPNIWQRINYAFWHLRTGKKYKDHIILNKIEIIKLINFLIKGNVCKKREIGHSNPSI